MMRGGALATRASAPAQQHADGGLGRGCAQNIVRPQRGRRSASRSPERERRHHSSRSRRRSRSRSRSNSRCAQGVLGFVATAIGRRAVGRCD